MRRPPFLPAAALLLAVVPAASAQIAPVSVPTLEEGLADMARSFQAQIGPGDTLVVGPVDGPPRLARSSGTSVEEKLKAALEAVGCKTDAFDGRFQVKGEFFLEEEGDLGGVGAADRAATEFGMRVELRLVSMTDGFKDVDKQTRIVRNEREALHALGVTAALKPLGNHDGGGAVDLRDRADQIKNAVHGGVPHVDTRGEQAGRVKPTRPDPFGVQALVGGRPVPAELLGSTVKLPFIDLPAGESYELRLTSALPHRTAAFVTIDGLDVFSPARHAGAPAPAFYVLPPAPPGGEAEALVRGWYVDQHTDAKFLVQALHPGAADLGGRDPARIGTITVSFAAAWEPDATPPPGESNTAGSAEEKFTAVGDKFSSKKKLVKLRVGRVRSVVTLRYNR